MSWNQTIRTIEATAKRQERESRSRHRQFQVRSKQLARLSAKEKAQIEAEEFLNQIELLTSVHKECGPKWNWKVLERIPEPVAPVHERHRVEEVISRRDAYSPGLLDKLFGKAAKQMEGFAIELEAATFADAREFQEAQAAFEKAHVEWREKTALAREVLAGSADAYSRVLGELAPFSEISELGSSLTFQVHSRDMIEVAVDVNAERIIPTEMKTLTASGRLSSKPMPKTRFNEIYADYVSGCLLRIAREAFAILPIEAVLATARAELFDSRTGHFENHPVLSVFFTRSKLESLNFDLLDPSDAIENFVHRGDFVASRKSGAFAPITALGVSDLGGLARGTIPAADHQGSSASSNPSGDLNPIRAAWREALERNRIEDGFLRLTANEIANAVGRNASTSFTVSESREIASVVQGFGFCIEPDPRFGAGNYWGTQELGIFPPSGGTVDKPSSHFLGASALLQLCLLVAAADGAVGREELDRFRVFIEEQHTFSIQERQRLLVLESLLARNPAAAKVTLGRTAKRLPQEQHLRIAKFLVDVAAADSVITPKEHKALTRIFEVLSLPPDTLDTLIRSLSPPGDEVVIQKAPRDPNGPGNSGLGNPGRDDAGFELDMSRIAAISAETSEVIGLLAAAMEDPEDVDRSKSVSKSAPSPPLPASRDTGERPTPKEFPLLEVRYHAALREVLAAESWTRSAFDNLARRHQMMPFGLMEALNEWSNEHLGEQLLEGEETILVHRNLVQT
ncbi:MAG: tellurite resistance TerB C-terminal domain-containing protein [Verrucomicrobiota bacterium]